jgi:hypothetical protein
LIILTPPSTNNGLNTALDEPRENIREIHTAVFGGGGAENLRPGGFRSLPLLRRAPFYRGQLDAQEVAIQRNAELTVEDDRPRVPARAVANRQPGIVAKHGPDPDPDHDSFMRGPQAMGQS